MTRHGGDFNRLPLFSYKGAIMADLIMIKGGSGDVPTLQDRELAYRKDEQALYIGSDGVNVRLCGANDVSGINTRLDALSQLITDIIARLDAMTPSE